MKKIQKWSGGELSNEDIRLFQLRESGTIGPDSAEHLADFERIDKILRDFGSTRKEMIGQIHADAKMEGTSPFIVADLMGYNAARFMRESDVVEARGDTIAEAERLKPYTDLKDAAEKSFGPFDAAVKKFDEAIAAWSNSILGGTGGVVGGFFGGIASTFMMKHGGKLLGKFLPNVS